MAVMLQLYLYEVMVAVSTLSKLPTSPLLLHYRKTQLKIVILFKTLLILLYNLKIRHDLEDTVKLLITSFHHIMVIECVMAWQQTLKGE